MHDEQHAGDLLISTGKSLVGWDHARLRQLSGGVLERQEEHFLSIVAVFSIVQLDDRRVPRAGGVQIVEVAAGDEINIVFRGHEVVARAEHLHDQRIAPPPVSGCRATHAQPLQPKLCDEGCAAPQGHDQRPTSRCQMNNVPCRDTQRKLHTSL
jgi:hypothetical protein